MGISTSTGLSNVGIGAGNIGAAGLSGNLDTTPVLPFRTDLQLWLDANDLGTITTDESGNVSQWEDKSGIGNNATQGTASRQPDSGTNSLNNRNVITFDGGDDFLSGPSLGIAGADVRTFIVVIDDADTGAGTQYVVDVGTGVGTRARYGCTFPLDGSNLVGSNYGSESFNSTAAISANATIIMWSYDGTDNYINVNGDSVDPDTVDLNTSNLAYMIASRFNGSPFQTYGGNIAEVLVYERFLSNSEKNQVGNYLEEKWGVTWTDVLPVTNNLELWLDASDLGTITKDVSDNVSQWDDKSGNGRHATQGTGSAQPLWVDSVQNGRSIIRGDGSADRMGISSFYTYGTTGSIFIVCTPNTTGTAYITSDNGALASAPAFISQFNGEAYEFFTEPLTPRFSFATTASGFNQLEFLFDESGTEQGYFNGNQVYDAASGAAMSGGQFDNIFSANNSVQFYDGDIAEILIYSTKLSDADRILVENYLSNKWNI